MAISDSTVAIIGIGNIGDLHEYGALGRVVTRTEALKTI